MWFTSTVNRILFSQPITGPELQNVWLHKNCLLAVVTFLQHWYMTFLGKWLTKCRPTWQISCFYTIFIPLSHVNLAKYGHKIWHFNTFKLGTPSKIGYDIEYLEKIRHLFMPLAFFEYFYRVSESVSKVSGTLRKIYCSQRKEFTQDIFKHSFVYHLLRKQSCKKGSNYLTKAIY